METPKIGDEIFILNPNRRVYRKYENGQSYGGPIHSEMWEPHKITGENSRSWITGYRGSIKISKKGPNHGIAFSRQEADEISYVADNCYRVAEMVRIKASYAQLKQIESILSEQNT